MRRTSGITDEAGRRACRCLAAGGGLRAWTLAGLMLALVAPVADPVQADTLPDVLAKTYETNPSLAAARAALRATNERVPQALANWGPVGRLVGAIGTGTGEGPGAAGQQPFGRDERSRSDYSGRETAR